VQPVLVLLSEDRRVISLLGQSGHRVLPRTPSPIKHVAASPFAPLINYTTETGEVYVYSILHGDILYHLSMEATS